MDKEESVEEFLEQILEKMELFYKYKQLNDIDKKRLNLAMDRIMGVLARYG